jgi:hypothetical protein
MRTTFLAATFLLTTLCGLQAQVPQPSPVLSPGLSNTWNLDWEGVYGRGYFLQHSDDLVNWQYFPLMEMGWGSTIPYGFSSSAERFFVRLRYTDDTSDFYWGDYDGDGVSNWDEIHTHGIDPFKADTDGDGVPDGAEIGSGTDPDDDQSAPDFWWQRTTRDLQYDFDDYEPPNNTGLLVRNALWNVTLNSTEQLSAPIPFPDLKGRLQELTFPYTLSATEGAIGLAVSEGYSNLLPHPPCYLATLNHQRHWLRSGTAWPEQYKKTVIILTERTIDGVDQTPEVDTEDVIVPANQLVSEPFDVESGFVQNFTGNEYHSEEVTTTPFTVEIEPDENQAGTTGDLIQSNKGAVGEKHYVSPKKTTEIPDDFVVLKATGVEQARFVELLEWEGGEAHPTDPLKRRVKRDAAAKTVVKIKVKQGGAEAAKMNVWVVWGDLVTLNNGVAGKGFFTQEVDPAAGGFARWWVVPNPANGRRFTFTIIPASIITEAERPALNGQKKKAAPGENNQFVIDGRDADEAENKWDMSRRFQIKVKNPGGILKGQLGDPAALFVNQPAAAGDPVVPLDIPVQLPQNPVEGNDDPPPVDPLWKDEDTNPYVARNEAGQQAHLNHGIGEMSSFDAPQHFVLNSWGVANREYGMVFNYQEFARLELWDGKRMDGAFWFRISPHINWHHALEAKFSGIDGEWKDNGSSVGLGHK